MEEFFIDVQLAKGATRLQVEEITPEEQAILGILLFTIDFYNGRGFTTLTLQLEDGKWHDRNTRLNENDYDLSYFDNDATSDNRYYQSPLSQDEVNRIGEAIANYMIVKLVARMSLFVPVFPDPKVN